MTNNEYDEEKFANRHRIKIVGQKAMVATNRAPSFFTNKDDASVVKFNDRYHRGGDFGYTATEMYDEMYKYAYTVEKLLVLEIPEVNFNQLMSIDRAFYARCESEGDQYMANLILQKEQMESKLRKTNASVAAAWEQYSLMLHLAR